MASIFQTQVTKRMVACAAIMLAGHLILAEHVALWGITPHFLLALAMVWACGTDARSGCVVGMACGFLFDLTGNGPFGLAPLLMCAAGYAVGNGGHLFTAKGSMGPAWAVTGAVVFDLAYMLLMVVFGIIPGAGIVGLLLGQVLVDGLLVWLGIVIAGCGRPNTIRGLDL